MNTHAPDAAVASLLASATRWTVRVVTALLVVVVFVGVVPANAALDLTVTRKAKISQNYRTTVDLRMWRASPHGQDISWRESHDVCSVVNSSGSNRGKWQMTLSLWRSYGGREFARYPERATCKQQDRVARRVWIDQWWWPWGG
ncbi:MAG: transglycosylase family protein [Actinomycetes bacterium]